MGPYQDSLSRKSTLFGPNTRPEIPIRFGYCAIPCIGGLCEERLPCFMVALVCDWKLTHEKKRLIEAGKSRWSNQVKNNNKRRNSFIFVWQERQRRPTQTSRFPGMAPPKQSIWKLGFLKRSEKEWAEFKVDQIAQQPTLPTQTQLPVPWNTCSWSNDFATRVKNLQRWTPVPRTPSAMASVSE